MGRRRVPFITVLISVIMIAVALMIAIIGKEIIMSSGDHDDTERLEAITDDILNKYGGEEGLEVSSMSDEDTGHSVIVATIGDDSKKVIVDLFIDFREIDTGKSMIELINMLNTEYGKDVTECVTGIYEEYGVEYTDRISGVDPDMIFRIYEEIDR